MAITLRCLGNPRVLQPVVVCCGREVAALAEARGHKACKISKARYENLGTGCLEQLTMHCQTIGRKVGATRRSLKHAPSHKMYRNRLTAIRPVPLRSEAVEPVRACSGSGFLRTSVR